MLLPAPLAAVSSAAAAAAVLLAALVLTPLEVLLEVVVSAPRSQHSARQPAQVVEAFLGAQLPRLAAPGSALATLPTLLPRQHPLAAAVDHHCSAQPSLPQPALAGQARASAPGRLAAAFSAVEAQAPRGPASVRRPTPGSAPQLAKLQGRLLLLSTPW